MKEYINASLVEIFAPIIIYLSYFVFAFMPWQASLSVAIVFGVLNTVMYFIVHKRHRKLLPIVSVIFSIAIGGLIATAFVKYGIYTFPDNFIVMGAFSAFFIIKTLFLMFGNKKYKMAVGILFSVILMITLIVTAVYYAKSPLFIESAVMAGVAMGIMIGEVLYFYSEDNIMSKINVLYVSVYYIILAIVLAVISEGDCMGDCCDDGLSGVCDGTSGKKKDKSLPPLEK